MIELYISETCPYCRKVMDYLDQNNVNYNKKDVAIPENLTKLLDKGGMHQVPFMIDDNISMYESSDIIEYVRGKYVL